MPQDREPRWLEPEEIQADPAALSAQLAGLVAYCQSVTGREDDAISIADAVLDSAQSLLSGPDQLRAWLFALARMELGAGSEPQAREVFDLVHRYGIRLEDVPVVLGIRPAEADELLAAAEAEDGGEQGWDDRPGWAESSQLADLAGYCRTLTDREESAVSAARSALGLARALLADEDRLRAWLFALARQEMLADAAAGRHEIIGLVHQHGIRAEDLHIVLGVPPAEADQLLAAAEEQYAASVFERADTDSRLGEGWEGGNWDDVFGPKDHRQPGSAGLLRMAPEPAGRHAAPRPGGTRLRQALSRSPVQMAAAAGIVVAVIGGGAAFLAAANSPPPAQASHQPRHHAAAATQSPATVPSPAPTATPTTSLAPSQPVTVVLPLPVPTSARPSPRPSQAPSPPPKSSPPPTPSPTTASPSPSSSPSSPSPSPITAGSG